MLLWPKVKSELVQDPAMAAHVARHGPDSYLAFEAIEHLGPTDPRRRLAMDPRKYVDICAQVHVC